MTAGRLDHLGHLVVATQQVGPDLRVAALDLVVDGLADIVQQPGPPGQPGVQTQLLGDHSRQVGHFHGVLQHVLPVTCPEPQAAHHRNQLVVDAADFHLHNGLFAGFLDFLVDLLARLGDHLLDPRGMDSPVQDQLGHGPPAHLATHAVVGTDDDHARGVVHNDVHAGGLLEGPDVASFAADHAALHLVVGNIDRGNRRFGREVAGQTLDGLDHNVAGLLGGLLVGPLDHAMDNLGLLLLHLLGDLPQEHLASFITAHFRNIVQQLHLAGQCALQEGLLLLELGLLVAEAALDGLDGLFFANLQLGLLGQAVLALLQSPLNVLEFLPCGLGLLLKLVPGLKGLVPGLQLGFPDDLLRFATSLTDDAVGLPVSFLVLAQSQKQPDHHHGQNQDDDQADDLRKCYRQQCHSIHAHPLSALVAGRMSLSAANSRSQACGIT